jgi:hypothetical protein
MSASSIGRRAAVGLALAAALVLLIDIDQAAPSRPGPVSTSPGPDRIIGVKIYDYEGNLGTLFAEWRSLGINTAFVSPALAAKPGFRYQARAGGIDVFLILPIFFNDEALERRPELAAITREGKPAVDDWVKFICPSRDDYRAERVEWVKELVEDLDPDGISLDFIRHFVFWEMVYPDRTLDSLPNTCFDESCLKKFQAETGIELPAGLETTAAKAEWIIKSHLQDWTDWKCSLITSLVKELAQTARAVKPTIKVNVHAVPWRASDFGGAIKIVAGQDLPAIGVFTDYVSPMCYHHMVRRPPAWIHSVVEEMTNQVRVPILPSIQVKEAYLPEELSVDEFREALTEALKPLSRGVVFWSWNTLGPDAERKAVVRELCAEE